MRVQNFNCQEILWRNLKLGVKKIENLASPMLLDNPLSRVLLALHSSFSQRICHFNPFKDSWFCCLLIISSASKSNLMPNADCSAFISKFQEVQNRYEIFSWFLISICLEKFDLRLTFIMTFHLIIWPLKISIQYYLIILTKGTWYLLNNQIGLGQQ